MTSNTRLQFTAAFQSDIADILQYTIELWGPEQADKYEDEIFEALERLRQYPELGRLVSGSEREMAIRHHVVLYDFIGTTVTLLRILHPRRLRDR